MQAALKLSWVMCATFSLAPSAYVLLVTYRDVRSGGPSWDWMLITFAMVAYAVVVVVQLVIYASARRSSGGWRRLALGYAALPVALVMSYVAFAPQREARRAADANESAASRLEAGSWRTGASLTVGRERRAAGGRWAV